jgi:hypothetical protein
MHVPDEPSGRAGYHPQLHCVLWVAYQRDPVEILASYGYTRPTPQAPVPGRVGARHPATSQQAARSPSHTLRWGSDRVAALLVLAQRGATGATAAEVHSVLERGSRNQWATRLLELREAGLAEYATEDGAYLTRPTGPNATGRVQRITPAGTTALRQLHHTRP